MDTTNSRGEFYRAPQNIEQVPNKMLNGDFDYMRG